MDFEPLAKRRRTLSPELGQRPGGDPYPVQFLEEPAEDDEAYKLYLERAFADPRFRDTVAKIFDKYGQKNSQDAIPSVDGATADGDPVDPALADIVADHGFDELLGVSSAGVDSGEAGKALELFQEEQHTKDSIPDDATVSTEFDIPESQLDRNLGIGPASLTFQPSSGQAPNFGPAYPGFDPRFAMMPQWYGPFPPTWEGCSLPFGMPPPAAGPWGTANGFIFAPGPWPQALSTQPNGQLPVPQQEGKTTSPCPDDKAPTMPPPPPPSKVARAPHPRFSKNGKRLGRPPKSKDAEGSVSSTLLKEMNDVAAYDGEGEDNGEARAQHAPVLNAIGDTGDVEDDEADLFWEDIAEIMGETSAAVNLVGRTGPILSRKRRSELMGSDDEADPEVVEKEQELRRLYKQLMSNKSQDSTDDQVDEAEGRRRSGRERKRVDFPNKVSWKKFCAERRVKHKIMMAMRSLAAKDRQIRAQHTVTDTVAVANTKDGAVDPATQDKPDIASATATVTAPKSTIPDSQESTLTLPIRSPHKLKATSDPKSSTMANGTARENVNDEDFLFSDDEAPTFLAKKPLVKAQFPVDASPKLGGATFFETVYALSDDEEPMLLSNVKPTPRADLAPVSASRAQQVQQAQHGEAGAEAAQLTAEMDDEIAEKGYTEEVPKTRQYAADEPVNDSQAIMEQLEDVMSVDYDPEDESSRMADRPEVVTKSVAVPGVSDNADGSSNDIAVKRQPVTQVEEDFASAVDALTGDVDMTDESNLLESLDAATDTAATSVPSDDGKSVEEPSSPERLPEMPQSAALNDPVEAVPGGIKRNKLVSPEPPIIQQPCGFATEHSGEQLSPPASKSPNRPTRRKTLSATSSQVKEDEPAIFITSSNLESPKKSKEKPARNTPPLESLFKSPPRRSALPLAPAKKTSKQSLTTPGPPTTARNVSSEPSKLASSASRASSVSRSSSKGHTGRRSLLSLVGGDDDLEDFSNRGATSLSERKRKATAEKRPTPRPGQLISTFKSGSSKAKTDADASSSKERRRKDKEKRRHSSYHETKSGKSRSKEKEKEKEKAGGTRTGTCGVDGYTCGRDFCFACL
ncbi:hypothetical protein K4F52_007436 [Lecanicillium sp. MT-2017a]|nr:hypothetical protein K4F52_007436 [Lecanicillium sp. MT-2017a]